VYVNAVGFHGATLLQDASRLAALTELLTQTVCDAASEERGVVDSFHGDRFLLSFNAASSCATHALRGARCALRIGQRLDAAAPVLRRAGWPALRITAGAASGPARCGTLGCQSSKRFTMAGAPVPQAAALEQLCRRHPREQHWRMPAFVSGRGDATPYRVLVSQSMLDDIQTQLTVECVDIVRLPVATLAALMLSAAGGSSGAPPTGVVVASQLLGERSLKADDEWMYALASDVNENGKAKGGDGLLGALQAGDAGDAAVSHVRVSCDADAIQRAKDAAWAAIGGGRGRAPSIASTALISEGNNSQPHGRPMMTKVLSYRSADSSSAGGPAAVGRIPLLHVAPPVTPVGGPQVMPLPTANRAFLLVGDVVRAAACAAAQQPPNPAAATGFATTAGAKGPNPNSGRILSSGVGGVATAAAASGAHHRGGVFGTTTSGGINGDIIVPFRGLAGLTAAAVARGGGTSLFAASTPTNAERASLMPRGATPSLPAVIERLLAPLEDLLRPYDDTQDSSVLYLRMLVQQALAPWATHADG
jgi:class 3 adenylate cyclase